MRNISSLVLICGIAIGVSSCESTTEVLVPDPNVVVSPTAGTIYVYKATRVDSSDNGHYTSYATMGVEILESAQVWGGKTNVTIASGPEELLHFAIEPNGDLSIGDSIYDGYRWRTYPFGSKQRIVFEDTVVNSGQYSSVRSHYVDYVGEEVVKLGDRSFLSKRVLEVRISNYISASTASYDTTYTHTWLSPEIGFITRQLSDQRSVSGEERRTRTLDYVLQLYRKKK